MFNNMLKISAVLGLVVLAATMTGCGGGEAVKFKLGTVEKVDGSVFDGKYFKKVLISKDQKIAYVLNNVGGLFNVDLSKDGVKSLTNKANYKKLTLKDDSAAKDGTAGKDKLDFVEPNPGRDRNIVLTNKGVVVVTKMNTAAGALEVGAVAYFEGANQLPTYAWTNQVAHVDSVAVALNTLFDVDKTIVVSHDNKEFVVVQADRYVNSVEIADVKKFVGYHAYAGAQFNANMQMVATEGSTAANPGKLFFIDANGISSITLDKLGADNDAVAVVAGSETDSLKWRMDTTTAGVPPGVPNNTVAQALLFNDKIYIALTVGANATGGIAIYDIKNDKAMAPDITVWNNKAATNLSVHDGKVRAIVDGRWVEITDKGLIGTEIFSMEMITANKYKIDKSTVADDVKGKTLYRGVSSAIANTREFASVVPVGDSMIINVAAAAPDTIPYIVSYESKEIELKAAKEKQE